MAVMQATDLRLDKDEGGRARDLMPVRSLKAEDLAAIDAHDPLGEGY